VAHGRQNPDENTSLGCKRQNRREGESGGSLILLSAMDVEGRQMLSEYLLDSFYSSKLVFSEAQSKTAISGC
jgi:hypothetical protein